MQKYKVINPLTIDVYYLLTEYSDEKILSETLIENGIKDPRFTGFLYQYRLGSHVISGILNVQENYRKQGIGTLLFERAEGVAKLLNFPILHFEDPDETVYNLLGRIGYTIANGFATKKLI